MEDETKIGNNGEFDWCLLQESVLVNSSHVSLWQFGGIHVYMLSCMFGLKSTLISTSMFVRSILTGVSANDQICIWSLFRSA
jgi:hypothetical protein